MTIYGYRNVSPGDRDAIARAWLNAPEELLARFVDRELAERGYTWDPDLTDDENRASFDDQVDGIRRRATYLETRADQEA